MQEEIKYSDGNSKVYQEITNQNKNALLSYKSNLDSTSGLTTQDKGNNTFYH